MYDYPFIENLGFKGGQGIVYPKLVNFEDKDALHRYHMLNMLKKSRKMFDYEGLPKEIPQRTLELYLQTQGFVILFEYEGKLHISYGGLGGEPDFNYLPTIATVSVPALRMSKMFKIYWGYEWESKQNVDTYGTCVVIPNDSIYMGLLPTHSYYASQLVENDLSINCNLINSRLFNILVADDDDSYKSLKELMDDLKNGKLSSAVDKNWLTDGIKSLPYGTGGSTNALIQLIEHRQYVKGSWWNELGVQSNYNMKRETITSSENILNVDSLLPVSDDMKQMREEGFKRAKEIFGIDVKVEFSSAWNKIQKEIKLKEDLQLKELESQKNDKSTQVDSEDTKNSKSIQVDSDKGGDNNVDEKKD